MVRVACLRVQASRWRRSSVMTGTMPPTLFEKQGWENATAPIKAARSVDYDAIILVHYSRFGNITSHAAPTLLVRFARTRRTIRKTTFFPSTPAFNSQAVNYQLIELCARGMVIGSGGAQENFDRHLTGSGGRRDDRRTPSQDTAHASCCMDPSIARYRIWGRSQVWRALTANSSTGGDGRQPEATKAHDAMLSGAICRRNSRVIFCRYENGRKDLGRSSMKC